MRVPFLVGGNSNVLVFCYTGNGSATFDPSLNTSINVNVSWKPDDAPETVTSGTTHNFSYTPSAGSHMCVVRVAGGLGLVTAVNSDNDAITSLSVERCSNLATYTISSNSFTVNIGKLPRSLIELYGGSMSVVGTVSNLPRGLRIIYGFSFMQGTVADYPATMTQIYQAANTQLSGSLADIQSVVATLVYFNGCTGITPGSIAHLTAIRDIRIYSMWPSLSAAASVDIVINSMWAARANYTYATPSLQIGGTNPAPTGNYIAPEEGSDWHNDGSKWIPLTPNAKVYDLVNDVNTEGFNTWTITTS